MINQEEKAAIAEEFGGAEVEAIFENEEGATKHTPGPWRLEEADGAAYVCMQVKALDGESLMGDERYYPWVPSNIADWHLISAAPELFDALRKLMDLESRGRIMPIGAEWDAARAAITKAEGVQ